MSIRRRDREAEHDREVRGDGLSRLQSDTGIVGVEDSFNEQEVHTTVTQGLYLFLVGLAQQRL